MGGHRGGSGEGPANRHKKKSVISRIIESSPTIKVIKAIGEGLAEGAKEHNLARRKKHIQKHNTSVPPSERINMTDEEIVSKEGLETLRKETGYTTAADVGKNNKDGPANEKSIVQPKVTSQMDNTEVKSKLIIADKTAPTDVEMTDVDRMLKVKRGKKTKTVLTQDLNETPKLSKNVLLGETKLG
jgi:hypothetical protein